MATAQLRTSTKKASRSKDENKDRINISELKTPKTSSSGNQKEENEMDNHGNRIGGEQNRKRSY